MWRNEFPYLPQQKRASALRPESRNYEADDFNSLFQILTAF